MSELPVIVRHKSASNSPMLSDHCILTQNTVAYLYTFGFERENKQEQKTLRLGCIAKVVQYLDKTLAVQIALSDNAVIDDCQWEVVKEHTKPVKSSLVKVLLGISSPSNRVKIVENESLCKELAEVKVGSKVYCRNNKIEDVPDSRHELAEVRYVGPIPELGTFAHYFGLTLAPGSLQGENDGAVYGRRYFKCQEKLGIFVSLDRISVCSDKGSSHSLMQSRVLKNEAGNFTATLDHQMNHRENMPRVQSSRVERTERLIDLEPAVEYPLKCGDRVVWVNDETGPEHGTVQWTGVLKDYKDVNPMVGVEFDNPVGSGTGMHNNVELFHTKKNHASFIPIGGLMKAEDFFGKPKDNTHIKNNSFVVIENGSGSSRQTGSLSISQFPAPSWRLESAIKTQRPQLAVWTSGVVQLPDYDDNNIKHSSAKDIPNKCEKNVCRSEYIFSESFPNINITKARLDNANKQSVNDVTNSYSTKTGSKVDSYPIGEARPKDYLAMGDMNTNLNRPTRRAMVDISSKKPAETKIRHSYSQDLQQRNSKDMCDFVGDIWTMLPLENTLGKDSTGTKFSAGLIGQPAKLNNNETSGLEIVGVGFNNHTNNHSKSNDHQEPLLSPNASISSDGSNNYYDTPDPAVGVSERVDLGVGSVVEVAVKDEPHYGVIRWIGVVPEDSKGRKVAGIEMEDELNGCSDGTFNGRRYFQCPPKKALFIGLNQCQKDGRFQDLHPHVVDNKAKTTFGTDDCPVIPGAVKPRIVRGNEDMETVCGKYRGIQGHHNSCYLDATLFSMFAFTSAFDSLLFRPRTKNDVPHYEEVQRVLREEIVNPLRKNQFCKWDRVMKLRTLLENHSSVTGLTSEEKDPEEFLTSLVAQILRAKPFLKLSSGQEAYHYQLFVEKDEQLRSPTVQQLFEQSFLSSDIKLKEVPSCLIIQMPRFGKSYKMYPRIIPSALLDVTDIIEDSPRQCTVCGRPAEFECKECFGSTGIGVTLESISFCASCIDTVHAHKLRMCHKYRRLTVPTEFAILQDHCQIPRLYMQLFAVVCIETSHYVSFVKCGSNSDAPWCFFDSMADRKGEQNGYNIPEVVSCPDLPYWLSEDGVKALNEVKGDRQLPEHAKRLFCDAYMCMYQSTEMMMYR